MEHIDTIQEHAQKLELAAYQAQEEEKARIAAKNLRRQEREA